MLMQIFVVTNKDHYVMVFFGVVNFSLRRYTFDYTTVISRFSVSVRVDFHCRTIFTSLRE